MDTLTIEEFARRLRRGDVTSADLVDACLQQIEAHNGELNAFIRVMADDARQKAEEAAAKTTIKLLFPLALFIAPAMGIVLLGPAMISIVKSFQHIF